MNREYWSSLDFMEKILHIWLVLITLGMIGAGIYFAFVFILMIVVLLGAVQ